MRVLDPTRDDAGVRLRALRLRRGMSQVALAELACISPALVSMVETGQRSLRSASHVLALANVLRVSPRYLADGWDDARSAEQRTSRTARSQPVPTPARWPATSSSPASSTSSPTKTAAPPGTGYAAWPENPPSTRGCCSTS